jgi:hypothetical protein
VNGSRAFLPLTFLSGMFRVPRLPLRGSYQGSQPGGSPLAPEDSQTRPSSLRGLICESVPSSPFPTQMKLSPRRSHPGRPCMSAAFGYSERRAESRRRTTWRTRICDPRTARVGV